MPTSEDPLQHLMRMKDARESVPRMKNETRSQWKNRVFAFKRKEDEKNAKAAERK